MALTVRDGAVVGQGHPLRSDPTSVGRTRSTALCVSRGMSEFRPAVEVVVALGTSAERGVAERLPWACTAPKKRLIFFLFLEGSVAEGSRPSTAAKRKASLSLDQRAVEIEVARWPPRCRRGRSHWSARDRLGLDCIEVTVPWRRRPSPKRLEFDCGEISTSRCCRCPSESGCCSRNRRWRR